MESSQSKNSKLGLEIWRRGKLGLLITSLPKCNEEDGLLHIYLAKILFSTVDK